MPEPIAHPLTDDPVLTGRDEDSPVLIDATQGGVVILTLNRPAKKNAFGPELVVALSDALDTLKGADHVHVVFLRGAGGNFAAWPDREHLAESIDWFEDDMREDAERLAAVLRKLADLPQLTVALVEGEAMGAAIGLIAACDLAVATTDARFAFPEVNLGLVPAIAAPYVIRAVGARTAKVLFATAHAFGAEHALRIGLVQEVIEAAALPDRAIRIAAAVRTGAPEAVRAAKALVEDFAERPIDRALMEETARRAAHRRASTEGREGVEAFLKARKPSWTE